MESKFPQVFRSLFFLFFLIATSTIKAQISEQYIFHHISAADGLLADEVNATVQDTTGYMWIGGKNGLQRYDGFRFINFRHKESDSTSIPHNNIQALAVDNKNRLWLITSNFKFGYFDVNKFTFHEVKVFFKNQLLNKVEGLLKLDKEKNLLLILERYGNAAYGVLTYDEGRNAFVTGDKRFDVPDDWHIEYFSIDSAHGNIWLGTTNGLIQYNTVTGNHNYRGHNIDNDPVINALQNYKAIANPFLDKQGNFWMTTFQNHYSVYLIEYNAKSGKVIDRTNELIIDLNYVYSEIHNILWAGNADTWLSGLNMLIRVNEKDEFEPVQNTGMGEFGLRFDDLRTMTVDHENNIWLATNKGIYWFNPSATIFHTIKNRRTGSDKTYSPDISDIAQLKNGTILVATWGNGLFAYNKNFEPVQSEIVQQGIEKGEGLTWCIHERSNGDVWRGQQDGYLFIYHAKENRTEKLQPPVFEKKTIRQIAEDRNGNLWLGTQGKALIKWTAASNTFAFIRRMDGLVKRLYTDKNGDIWVIAGTVDKINIDDGSVTEEYTVDKADGKHLLSPDLSDIIQYNDSTFVIAGEGVNILNSHAHRFTYLTSNDGLLSDYISNLMPDNKGNLWMSTEGGIYVINFANKMNSTYGIEDGIINNNFNYATSSMLDDGRILFGTNHDFILFDPANLNSANYNPPRVQISAIKLFGKRLPVDSLMSLDKINLGYDQNSLSFEFSTLTFQTKYTVAYKMDDIDKDWIIGSAGNEAVYSYLPPGNYTFEVGSPDSRGTVKNIRTLNIHVSAPIWKTWKFYVTLILLAAIIIWYFYKERMKRMKDILKMRNIIGKDLHKEVRTTLKNISVLSEIAAMKADHNLEQSKDYIQEIKQKSRSSVIAMDDVMWSIDPANDSMAKTMDRMNEIADILQNEYDMHVEIELENRIEDYKMSMKQRLEFIMIYKRAMLMLCRDLRSPLVNLMLEVKNKDLLLKIFATGMQLPKYDQKIIKGIEEIQSRAASISGLADVQSDSTGTAIIAVVKHHRK